MGAPLIIPEIMPLRLMGGEFRTLCCSYESAPNDKLTISSLEPTIAYILAEPLEQGGLLLPFSRHFLLSEVGEYNFLTGSGYMFNGAVNVYVGNENYIL